MTLVSLSGAGVSVAIASAADGQATVHKWSEVARPEGLDSSNAGAVGSWLKSVLHGLGASGRSGVFVVGHGDVFLKRLTFDVNADERVDLPGMVRLQMVRQLTFPGDDATVDFIVLRRGSESASAGLAGKGSQVLCAAMPGDRRRWLGELAASAGLKVARIAIRPAAIAALAREVSAGVDGSTLVLALDREGADFVVVQGGQMVFARRADVVGTGSTESSSHEEFAVRVATEARRTWLSYRGTPETTVVHNMAVIGDGEVARDVARRCSDTLELPVKLLNGCSRVRVTSNAESALPASVFCLVGAALESALGIDSFDLAHPRKAPDRRERRRQAALAAALVGLVAAGSLFTMGNLRKISLESEIRVLESQRSELLEQRRAALRDSARLAHVKAWMSGDVPWLSHLEAISRTMPETDRAVAAEISGTAKPFAGYERARGTRDYEASAWRSAVSTSILLRGRARDRGTADAVREAFVNDRRYTVTPVGQDSVEGRDGAYPAEFAMTLAARANIASEASGGPEGTEAPRGREAKP